MRFEQEETRFPTVYAYKEDSVVVSDGVPGKGTLVTRYVMAPLLYFVCC